MNHKALVEKAAASTRTDFIEWSDTWRDELEDVLADADVLGSWEDHGIGSYEYWGAHGVHHDFGYTIEGALAVVKFKGVDFTLSFPNAIKTSHSGGGCDGEHRGRCRAACAEWEADVSWKSVYQKVVGGDLYVVFEGDQV